MKDSLSRQIQLYRRRIVHLDRYLRLGKLHSYITQPKEWIRRKRCARAMQLGLPSPLVSLVEEIKSKGAIDVSSIIDDQVIGDFLGKTHPLAMSKLREIKKSSINKSLFVVRNLIQEQNLHDEATQIALQPNLLQIITSYIGHVPILANVEVILTYCRKCDHWSLSQNWHRDFEDSKQLKLVIYLSDVLSQNDGPITYLPASESNKFKTGIFTKQRSDIEKLKMYDHVVYVNGPALTATLLDVHNCYHHGSRLGADRYRLTYIAEYTTHAPNRMARYGALRSKLPPSVNKKILSDLEKLY